jgi:ligand-binding sensor domain-containing protein
MAAFFGACKQNQDLVSPETIMPDSKPIVSAYGPTRMVRSVKQAKNGDMLIASYTGVWRYDGKLFTNITTGILSPSFWDVLEDQKGNLWFGTKDSGVYYYNGKTFLHYTTRQGLPGNTALHLFEDKSGNIWIAAGDGVTRFDGKSFKNYTTKDGLPSGGVNTFMEDKKGKIWMGTRSDACYFDGNKFTVFKNKEGKTFYNVWSFVEDKKGNIWFGGSTITKQNGNITYHDGGPGLWRYDGTDYAKVSAKSASAIIQDKNGNIWTTGATNPVGLGPWNLLRYDKDSLSYPMPAFSEIASIDKMLCRIAEANDGSIWFGSIKGVYRWDGKSLTNFQRNTDELYKIDIKQSRITWKGSMKISPEEKHIGYIYISKGDLWDEQNQLVGGEVDIDMNSMEYADKKEKNTPIFHLKSEDYFNVKKNPTAAIVLTKVDKVNDTSFNITANLTIKGVTNEVKFPATITIANGILNASAQFSINRTKWGITYRSEKLYEKIADYTVSNEIEFVLKIVAKK